MASVVSLGVHTPSALPFLVAEGILPQDPSPNQYQWRVYGDDEDDINAPKFDEVVFTDDCVVWSRGDVVQKIFKFEVEKQKIHDAVLTWFKSAEVPESGFESNPSSQRASSQIPKKDSALKSTGKGKKPPRKSFTSNYATWRQYEFSSPRPLSGKRVGQAQALVVILRSQAHVFFLSGTSHVVNVPFEVEKALPSPWGLFLQRKLPVKNSPQTALPLPPVPHNSFLAPQLQSSQSSQSSLSTPKPRTSKSPMLQFAGPTTGSTPNVKDNVPRLFTLTDPLTEVGLVVCEASFSDSSNSTFRRRGPKPPYEALSISEEIVFTSTSDEISDVAGPRRDPLIFVVTLNRNAGVYTVWYALHRDSRPLSSLKPTLASSFTESTSKRRSSFNPGAGTGTTTPAIRVRDNARESFAADQRLGEPSISATQRTAPGESASQSQSSQNAEDAFASQVDPDFQGPRNPARESRRISSFISRADLSTGPERSNFVDSSKGQAQSGASSATVGRRGQSLGGQHERKSFGGLSSIRSRASTPGSSSRPSFLDDDLALNDQKGLAPDFLATDFGSLEFQEPLDTLPKQVALVKVQTILMNELGLNFSQSSGVDRNINPDVHVLVVQAPKPKPMDATDNHGIDMYILDRTTQELVVVGLTLTTAPYRAIFLEKNAKQHLKGERHVIVPEFEGVQRFQGCQDIARLRTSAATTILSLCKRESELDICLQNSNLLDNPLRLARNALKLFNPFSLAPSLSPSRREAGLKRTIQPPDILFLRNPHSDGSVDLQDRDGSYHRLQIGLCPRSDVWDRVLKTAQYILPVDEAESIRLFWCAAHNWLMGNKERVTDVESTATCITLFSMFVDRVRSQARKQPGSSQAGVSRHSAEHRRDMSQQFGKTDNSWLLMMASDFQHGKTSNFNEAAWGWAVESAKHPPMSFRSPAKSTRAADSTFLDKNPVIVEAIGLARRFLAEDDWAKAIAARAGWTGPIGGDELKHRHTINSVLVQGLHLVREESKLNVLMKGNGGGQIQLLALFIAQMAHWLGWQSWSWRIGDYYELEGARLSEWAFGDSARTFEALDPPSGEPPSILKWIEDMSAGRTSEAYPTLENLRDSVRPSTRNLTGSSSSRFPTAKSINPRSQAIISYLTDVELKNVTSFIHVQKMMEYGIDAKVLETLPIGIAAPLREHIIACQASPPTTWSEDLLRLIGREDLHLLAAEKLARQPDTVTVSENSTSVASDMRSICRSDDHHEPRRSPWKETYAISRLIFNEDKRHSEASDILEPYKPSVAECRPNPQWSEAQYLEAQKEVMQWVMVRTIALYPGSAMVHFDSTHPMPTEKFFLPGFSTQCIMKPLNITVSADRVSLTEEKFSWAFFHAGVAKGLSIALDAEGIDTSWIVFNKPAELMNRHAGLLLALGLNGHLRPMAKWLAFKYLTPKHTMTSIGLLLGLSASFLGTTDQLVTRLLSVHVTRMLPDGAAELNVSPMTQTAGLMGIGLLYYDTQHRRMSEIMLSEIRHIEFEDPMSGSPDVLRDESYRLAAGFALGLINLAQGRDLRGLHNMGLVDRLLEVVKEDKPRDAIHIIDQATAGATIAIGLIFMRTGDAALARKIGVPDTLPQFETIRPDQFLLRTLAKHLIMWNNIRADRQWVKQNILEEYKSMTDLSTIYSLKSDHMPFFNILAGLLWSISLKYAGSGDIKVRDFLVGYLDQFIRLCKLPALHYDARLARTTVRNCQDLLGLAAATVMAGRGDLIVFRRLRLLHGRVHADTPYGSHLAAHLALGALFLGSGRYTFGTSKLATAALICAFYPLFPNNVLDNRGHLQAFRHFWVFAAEARCLVIRDVDTHRAIPLPIIVIQRSGTTLHLNAPILLPELDTIAQVRTNSPHYWQVTLDFAANPEHLAGFRRNQTVFVRRRPAGEVHGSAFHNALVALNDAQSAQGAKQMWDYIFELPVFASSKRFSVVAFDRAEWGSVLPTDPHSSVNLEMKGTVVDTRLSLSRSVDGWERDELIQLRMLFTWAEKMMVEEGGRLRWLGREVVQGLKAKVAMRVKELESES
ncbi:MAG: hypothetical protein Q9157_002984 [Trypethelium eluteriae]